MLELAGSTPDLTHACGEGAGKCALITGIHGFTGRYMAHELRAAGYHVVGTVMSGEASGPDLFAVDLCEHSAVSALIEQVQPDVVVHLAGIAFVAHANADLIYRVNLLGTRNLLDALARSARRPDMVLLASSANVYGNADAHVIDENVAPAPANDYAVSKLAMEYMARLWSDKLPIVIVRPFNYTGVGQHENFLLPKIVAHFRQGASVIELGNVNVARDFSDVRTVVNCYRRLLVAPVAGLTLNICSGVAHSLGEVLALMSGIAGRGIEVRVNPAFVRESDVLRLVGSNARLTQVIGEVACTPVAQTLRWMYQA